MKVDGKKLASEYVKSKKEQPASVGEDKVEHGGQEYNNCIDHMSRFIEAIHNKEPHEAHKHIVAYSKSEPHRLDQEGRDKSEDKGSKMSMKDEAKYYRKARYQD